MVTARMMQGIARFRMVLVAKGVKMQELARAQELAETHRQLIVDKWHEHLD